MSTWLVVWFIVGIVTTLALVALLVALGRHALIVGRSARQAQEALAPLTGDIARSADRASARAQGFRLPAGKAAERR